MAVYPHEAALLVRLDTCELLNPSAFWFTTVKFAIGACSPVIEDEYTPSLIRRP
jgi:hypothetical protein